MTNMRQRKEQKASLYFFLTLFAVLLLLIFPKTASEGVRNGLSVAYTSVIPAVLPFMIVSDILLSLDLRTTSGPLGRIFGKLFGFSPIAARAVLIGLLGGFPIGARCTSELFEAGVINKAEGERLLYLSSLASPAFVITGIGVGLIGDPALALRLYSLILFSHLFTGMLLPKDREKKEPPICTSLIKRRFSITGSIESAAASSMKIAAYLAFFSVCRAVICHIIKLELPCAILSALLEIGSGSAYAITLSSRLSIPLLAFCISFSGLSVYMQIKSFAKKNELEMKRYLTGKIVSSALSFTLAFLFLS